jgi:hypothetical protein
VQADEVQAANGESLGKDSATPVTFDVESAAGSDVALVGILRGMLMEVGRLMLK